jgi:hypothetical protein
MGGTWAKNNTLPSGHSTLVGIECSVAYILRVVSGTDSTTPTERVKIQITPSAQHRGFNVGIQERMRRLVYMPGVRSWYVDGRSGRNTLVWPGTQGAFW